MNVMRKIYFFLASSFCVLLTNAQNVGVGTSNPQNKLHVAGGFRLDTLTGVNGAGLLKHDANGVVYGIKFSGIATDVLRGDGTFGSGGAGSVGWSLTGNSGTNPATHFIGTNDDQPLSFRLNNVWAGQFNQLTNNYGIGIGALQSNTTGTQNVGFGHWALLSNTTGSANTSIGNDALSRNTTGNSNTGIGNWALLLNTTGARNTAIGDNALSRASTENDNTAIGYFALLSNTEGSKNTAIGSGALFANSFGDFNTATGFNSLSSNTSGSGNCAFGREALTNNTAASDNSAFGERALYSNITGRDNVAVGPTALYSNISGEGNIAVGKLSLANNNGSFNTSVGANSLKDNTVGQNNTAAGSNALEENTSGRGNTAMGKDALSNNKTGTLNVAVGLAALDLNEAGDQNVAIGGQALGSTRTSNNVGIGYVAGISNINGSGLTLVGTNSNVNVDNLKNATAIGWGSLVNASDKMRLGYPGTTVSASSYITESDGRFKEQISDTGVPGLSFIKGLHPVTYNFNYQTFDDFLRKDMKSKDDQLKQMGDQKHLIEKSKKKEIGFVAEDVEKLIREKGFTFNGIYTPQNENDNYGLDYSKFVVPLVKAVQEQQQIIEEQNKKLEKQQQQIDLLVKEMQALKKDLATQKN
jgi:hypothetical protein